MTSISPLLSNGYYSLNNQSSGTQNTPTTDTAGLALANALGTDHSAATTDHSYSLDLSPDALAYIKALNLSGTASPTAAVNSTENFVLNKQQQQTLDAIVANYKDAPFTQATFDRIQDDLKAAGLSTETLAAQDKVRNFNPTQFFLDALNGTNSDDTGDTGSTQATQASSDTKATNFMKQVADRWARSSTTVADS